MAESRWAPDRTPQLIINLKWNPGPDHQVFMDVTDEGMVPSYPIASVVDCRSPVDIELGVCLASRWAIRDAALASMRQALSEQDHPRGP